MWWWKRKTLLQQGIFQGFTDNHSHILWGVDDGVETKEESIEIIKRYEEWGVKSIWLTPHIQEYIPNETIDLRERYAELRESYQGPISLHLAAEYMLDNLFEQRFSQNDLLFHSEPERLLLVETSYFIPPIGLEQTLYRIKQQGITPILAHPERYTYMDEDQYRRIRSMGVRFQLNLGSLIGYYGKREKLKAKFLLDNKMVDMLGSDIHSSNLQYEFTHKKTDIILNS